MRVTAVTQVAGKDSHAAVLRDLLLDRRYTRLRLLVAFARWSGLHLLDDRLQAFAARGRIDAIVGVDLGGTTIEALTYLHDLPNCSLRVVSLGRSDAIFHPKLYLFDGPSAWAGVAGSANVSTGGLFKNAEASILVQGGAKEASPFEAQWRQFDTPLDPVRPEHVREVNSALLEELAPKLDTYTDTSPDAGRPRMDAPAVEFVADPPRPGRPPAIREARQVVAGGRAAKVVSTTAVAPTSTGELYLELWDETGGGTQVQLPKKVFTDYFGGAPGAVTYVTLSTPAGKDRVRLQTFPNSTWRIHLGFVARYPTPGRRAVLKFVRVSPDQYDVSVRLKGANGYRGWLAKCTEGRSNSKRYGIYS